MTPKIKVYFRTELLVFGSRIIVVGSEEGVELSRPEEVDVPRMEEGEEVGELFVTGCWFETVVTVGKVDCRVTLAMTDGVEVGVFVGVGVLVGIEVRVGEGVGVGIGVVV